MSFRNEGPKQKQMSEGGNIDLRSPFEWLMLWIEGIYRGYDVMGRSWFASEEDLQLGQCVSGFWCLYLEDAGDMQDALPRQNNEVNIHDKLSNSAFLMK